jgi:hypothetical protein
MSIYDFLVQNQGMMEQIEFAADGAIEVPPNEFGFSNPSLEMEVVKHQMVFEVDIGQFKVRTKVWIENFAESVERSEVIELIETNYREEASLQVELEESNVEEATSRRDQAKEDFDLIVDTLRGIKTAWKIP